MGPFPASDPAQPYPALPGLLLCRLRRRRSKSQGWPARGERRTREALAGLARLCACVLPREPCLGLRPPQLGGGFRFAAAAMESELRPRLCDLQCRYGVHGIGVFPAFCRIRLAPARCAAALGLRHLSLALYLHHLAAIRRL